MHKSMIYLVYASLLSAWYVRTQSQGGILVDSVKKSMPFYRSHINHK
jgi:hypothetical protein